MTLPIRLRIFGSLRVQARVAGAPDQLERHETPDPVRPDAVEPRIHCARTHWILGFMAFQLVWRTRTVMLMVPV